VPVRFVDRVDRDRQSSIRWSACASPISEAIRSVRSARSQVGAP